MENLLIVEMAARHALDKRRSHKRYLFRLKMANPVSGVWAGDSPRLNR
jgi:hypothetical protein